MYSQESYVHVLDRQPDDGLCLVDPGGQVCGWGRGQRRKKVKFDDGYRSSQDRDGSGMVKEAEGLGQTSEEGEEQKEEEEEVVEETELVEVFPPEGVEAKLDQLLNHRIGVLTVNHPDTGRPLLVLFNIT